MTRTKDIQAKYLSDIIRRACELKYLSSLQFGTLIRTLLDCSVDLSPHEKLVCIENTADALRDSGFLNSPEFYEGIAHSIPSDFLISLLRITYLDDNVDQCEFCRVVSSLSSSGSLKLVNARLFTLRETMSAKHIRNLCAMIADNSCDDIERVSRLLRRFYHPDETFEVAEAMRTMTKQDWFVDIVPRNRSKALALFKKTIIKKLPSTAKVLEHWAENGEDSDYESDNGSSLADFIVSDEETSACSEEEPPKKKRRQVVIDSD